LPAPPAYPAVIWQADGSRLSISAADAQALYNFLIAVTSWADGVMAERQLYFQDKK
jgi:hypothetical protein